MTASADNKHKTVIYVYGVVPADVEAEPEARGVGDPPSEVDVVRHNDVAVLISEIPAEQPLGRPEDLTAHAQLLDAVAPVAPILPMRFGAVVNDRQAVEEELLAEHADEFLETLKQLEGKVQHVVKGRYVEGTVLGEVLSENPDAGRLRDRIQGKPEDATRDDRISLGELISKAVTAKRDADSQSLQDALEPICSQVAVREPTHELDAIQLACLVESDKESEFSAAVDEYGQEHEGRIELRVLGPMAAYDFVMTREAG